MRIALTALGFCLLAGSAFAQSSYDDRSRDEGRGNAYDSRSNDSRSEASAPTQRSDDWDQDQSQSEGRSPNARGASFYLKSGDKEFRVDCGDDDSTRECVDAALTMFREIQKPVAAASATPSSATSVTGSSPGSATGR